MGDEKKVPYRKRIHAGAEAEDLADDSDRDNEASKDEEISLYGEDKFAKLKNYVIKQIDLLEEDEVEMIKFEFDAKINQMYFQCWKTQTAD